MQFLPLILCAAVLIFLSLIFSGTESAFLSINKLRIRFLHNQNDKKAMRVWRLLNDKERLINTLLVANDIVNIALSAILTYVALGLFGNAGVGIATFAATLLLLVFGEISPKTIATHHPEPIAFLVAPFIEVLEVVLFPLVAVFTSFSRFVLRIFHVDTSKKKVSFTEEEIKTFIDVGREQGVLENSEKVLMHRVFKFTDLSAKDIMIPRKKIRAVKVSASYRDVVELSERYFLSRFPVYGNDIDDIVGVIYVKDLLQYKDKPESFSCMGVMRPPLFILRTKKMSSIQQMLRENHQSLAIVIDEYSGTSGILTTEDIAREIFGPISDEYKPYSRHVEVHIKNPASANIEGLARLIDINEQLGTRLVSKRNETIGGYIEEVLGHIPVPGESIYQDGFTFTVVSLEENRISEVHLSNLKKGKV